LDGLRRWHWLRWRRFMPMLVKTPLLASDYCLPVNLNALFAVRCSAHFNVIIGISVVPSWWTI